MLTLTIVAGSIFATTALVLAQHADVHRRPWTKRVSVIGPQ
jgi:hypothetical protein